MPEIATLFAVIGADASSFESTLDSVESRMRDSAGVVEKAGQGFKSIGKDLAVTGAGLTGLGAGLVAGLVDAVRASIDFEQQFAGVRKTVQGSVGDLEQIRSQFRDLATDVDSPTAALENAHEQIARIGEIAGQLGRTKDNIADFTRVVSLLGVTTDLGIGKAALGLGQLSAIMETADSDIGRLGATIVDLGNKFETNESNILNFATRAAGASKIVGLTEKSLLGLAAAFSAVGVRPEAGASALSRTFIIMSAAINGSTGKVIDHSKEIARLTQRQQKLQQTIRITEQQMREWGKRTRASTKIAQTFKLQNAQQELADTTALIGQLNAEQGKLASSGDLATFASVAGLTTKQFRQLFRTKPERALQAFIAGLAKIKKSGGDVFGILESLGLSERRVIQLLLSAAGAEGKVGKALDIASSAWDENTALMAEASKRADTVQGAINVLKNNIYDLKIALTDGFRDPLKKGIKALASFVFSIRSLPPPALKAVGAALALAAGLLLIVGPLTTLAGLFLFSAGQIATFVSSAGGVGSVLALIVTRMLPVLGIVGLLTAAVSALGLAWSKNFLDIQGHVSRAVGELSLLKKAFKRFFDDVGRAFEQGGIGAAIEKAGESFVTLRALIDEQLRLALVEISAWGNDVVTWARGQSGEIAQAFDQWLYGATQWIVDLGPQSATLLGRAMARMLNVIPRWLGRIATAFAGGGVLILQQISEWGPRIIAGLPAFMNKLSQAFFSQFGEAGDRINKALQAIGEDLAGQDLSLDKVLDSIDANLGPVFDQMMADLNNQIEDVKTRIRKRAQDIAPSFDDFVNFIRKDLPRHLITAGRFLLGVGSVLAGIVLTYGPQLAAKAPAILADFVSTFLDAVGPAGKDIRKGLGDLFAKVKIAGPAGLVNLVADLAEPFLKNLGRTVGRIVARAPQILAKIGGALGIALLAIGPPLFSATIRLLSAFAGGFLDGLGAVGASIRKHWNRMLGGISSTPIGQLFGRLIVDLQKTLGPASEVASRFISQLAQALSTGGISAAIERFKALWPDTADAIGSALHEALQHVREFAQGIFDELAPPGSFIRDVIVPTAIDLVKNFRTVVPAVLAAAAAFQVFMTVGSNLWKIGRALRGVYFGLWAIRQIVGLGTRALLTMEVVGANTTLALSKRFSGVRREIGLFISRILQSNRILREIGGASRLDALAKSIKIVTVDAGGLAGIIGSLAAALGPVGLALVLVGAIALAVFAAWKTGIIKSTGLTDKLREGWNKFVAAIGPAREEFSKLVGTFNREILPVLGAITKAIVGILAFLGGIFLAGLSGALSGFGQFLRGVVEIVSGIFQILVAIVGGVLNIIVDLLKGDWRGAWEDARQAVSDVADGIISLVTGLKDTLFGLVRTIVGGVVGAFEWLYNRLVGGSIVPDLVNGIAAWFLKLPDQITSAIGDAMPKAVSKVQGMADRVLVGFRSRIGNAFDAGLAFGQTLVGGIKAGSQAPVGAVQRIADDIRRLLPSSNAKEGPLSDLYESGLAFGATFGQGVDDSRPGVEKNIRTFAEAMLGNLKGSAQGFQIPLDASLNTDAVFNTLDDLSHSGPYNFPIGVWPPIDDLLNPDHLTNQPVTLDTLPAQQQLDSLLGPYRQGIGLGLDVAPLPLAPQQTISVVVAGVSIPNIPTQTLPVSLAIAPPPDLTKQELPLELAMPQPNNLPAVDMDVQPRVSPPSPLPGMTTTLTFVALPLPALPTATVNLDINSTEVDSKFKEALAPITGPSHEVKLETSGLDLPSIPPQVVQFEYARPNVPSFPPMALVVSLMPGKLPALPETILPLAVPAAPAVPPVAGQQLPVEATVPTIQWPQQQLAVIASVDPATVTRPIEQQKPTIRVRANTDPVMNKVDEINRAFNEFNQWDVTVDARAHGTQDIQAAGNALQQIQETPTAITLTVQGGDTLSGIAQQVLGDAREWPKVFEANIEVIGPDPNVIRPGQKLRIPLEVNRGLVADAMRLTELANFRANPQVNVEIDPTAADKLIRMAELADFQAAPTVDPVINLSPEFQDAFKTLQSLTDIELVPVFDDRKLAGLDRLPPLSQFHAEPSITPEFQETRAYQAGVARLNALAQTFISPTVDPTAAEALLRLQGLTDFTAEPIITPRVDQQAIADIETLRSAGDIQIATQVDPTAAAELARMTGMVDEVSQNVETQVKVRLPLVQIGQTQHELDQMNNTIAIPEIQVQVNDAPLHGMENDLLSLHRQQQFPVSADVDSRSLVGYQDFLNRVRQPVTTPVNPEIDLAAAQFYLGQLDEMDRELVTGLTTTADTSQIPKFKQALSEIPTNVDTAYRLSGDLQGPMSLSSDLLGFERTYMAQVQVNAETQPLQDIINQEKQVQEPVVINLDSSVLDSLVAPDSSLGSIMATFDALSQPHVVTLEVATQTEALDNLNETFNEAERTRFATITTEADQQQAQELNDLLDRVDRMHTATVVTNADPNPLEMFLGILTGIPKETPIDVSANAPLDELRTQQDFFKSLRQQYDVLFNYQVNDSSRRQFDRDVSQSLGPLTREQSVQANLTTIPPKPPTGIEAELTWNPAPMPSIPHQFPSVSWKPDPSPMVPDQSIDVSSSINVREINTQLATISTLQVPAEVVLGDIPQIPSQKSRVDFDVQFPVEKVKVIQDQILGLKDTLGTLQSPFLNATPDDAAAFLSVIEGHVTDLQTAISSIAPLTDIDPGGAAAQGLSGIQLTLESIQSQIDAFEPPLNPSDAQDFFSTLTAGLLQLQGVMDSLAQAGVIQPRMTGDVLNMAKATGDKFAASAMGGISLALLNTQFIAAGENFGTAAAAAFNAAVALPAVAAVPEIPPIATTLPMAPVPIGPFTPAPGPVEVPAPITKAPDNTTIVVNFESGSIIQQVSEPDPQFIDRIIRQIEERCNTRATFGRRGF